MTVSTMSLCSDREAYLADSSHALVDLPDLINSPDCKPPCHLRTQSKHRYWKPRKKLSFRPRRSSSVAADKLPEGPASSSLTNELLGDVCGEALPPFPCGQPNAQCSRICSCSRQHSPCELPSRTLVGSSNPHRETTCMVLNKDDQVHHVHHIHHVHHVYHYHHHLRDLGVLAQSDSTVPGFLSSTTSLTGQLCCSNDSGRPHNLPVTTPVSCGCSLELVDTTAHSVSPEMLGIQQSVVTNVCPVHPDSGVSRTHTPNLPSQPRSSSMLPSPVPLASCRSSSSLCCSLYCSQHQQQQQQPHFGPGCTLHPIIESFATGEVIPVTDDSVAVPPQPSGTSDNSPPSRLTAHSHDPCTLTSTIPGRLTVANCVQPVASNSLTLGSEPVILRSHQRANESTISALPSASPTSVERTLAPLPMRTSAIVAPIQSTRISRTGRTLTSSVPFSATDLQQSRLSFQRSMLELRKMGWYWGPLTFQEAQVLLAKRPDGTFLVRDSGHDTYILSLSFRVRGETYHTRIEHSLGNFTVGFQYLVLLYIPPLLRIFSRSRSMKTTCSLAR
ncbi:uncharacterized protein DEA37_0004052 [Paragonimus westermani]|uniref:SH2 domain-containing protein n=1 Tax=Paragonimus westermani TaxID=34504 RepID=A0A5J4NJF3_9TREM|nr:uncharacterized protein DEA37_0004052 [Paragonimus westermani]